MLLPEGWAQSKNILVILAHPDDPDFFCGASIARWVKGGHRVNYCLLTKGEKGADDSSLQPSKLAELRMIEQRKAGDVLGVGDIGYLKFKDGNLRPTLTVIKEVVAEIRRRKPDVVVTCDPTNYYPREDYINHPDHRAAGQIVLEASFPASGNPHYFPELMRQGLEPHTPEEVWCSLAIGPNTLLDVTQYWPIKIEALLQHKSQIKDEESLRQRMMDRRTSDSSAELPRFEEAFKRIIFRKAI